MRGWVALLLGGCLLADRAAAQSEVPSRVDAPVEQSAEPTGAPVAAEQAPAELPGEQVPAEPPPSSLSKQGFLSIFQLHGFVSQGGFVSTANEAIGQSSRGSLKFFELGLNVSAELYDRLRVGVQFVSRSVGVLSEEVPRVDWAVIDYRWLPVLGFRAGVIKIPLGLYNETIGVDATRTAILLPQSLYPLRNRDALVSHTGLALYGNVALGPLGGLDYQAWFGSLSIPRSALELDGASLDSVDTKYVAGGQLFYRPIEGLRFGGSYMHTSVDFHLIVDPGGVSELIAAGLVPPNYQGQLRISQDPTSFWAISAELIRGNLSLAAEYGRARKREVSSLPALLPKREEDAEAFYVLASYRFTRVFELGGYYSVTHKDPNDRRGEADKWDRSFRAFQRDLTATLRFDVNEYWLWKVEGHFIDGVAELQASVNPNPSRYWGLFLFRTTVTF